VKDQSARLSALAGYMLVTACGSAQCQSVLPRLETIPAPAPVGEPFYAVVSLPANTAALGFYGLFPQPDMLQIDGNSITARFESGCGFICPGGGLSYAGFPLPVPALPAGPYQLTIVDATFPEYVWGTFPLTIGPGPAPALVTHPRIPPANQPFTADLRIWAHPDDLGVDGPAQIAGNLITVDFDDYSYCALDCSNESTYRSFPVSFPPLSPGTYEVKFVAAYVYGVYPPWPPLPNVADFSLVVGAAPTPAPATSDGLLLLLGSLVIVTVGSRSFRARESRPLIL
jgi:hypothetical protein